MVMRYVGGGVGHKATWGVATTVADKCQESNDAEDYGDFEGYIASNEDADDENANDDETYDYDYDGPTLVEDINDQLDPEDGNDQLGPEDDNDDQLGAEDGEERWSDDEEDMYEGSYAPL
jgi:hypothetical protein